MWKRQSRGGDSSYNVVISSVLRSEYDRGGKSRRKGPDVRRGAVRMSDDIMPAHDSTRHGTAAFSGQPRMKQRTGADAAGRRYNISTIMPSSRKM